MPATRAGRGLGRSHLGGSSVCPKKQPVGVTGMREVRGSVLVAGVGPQVTTHVPGAGCCQGECLYLPKNRAGWGGAGEECHLLANLKLD